MTFHRARDLRRRIACESHCDCAILDRNYIIVLHSEIWREFLISSRRDELLIALVKKASIMPIYTPSFAMSTRSSVH